jgi:hypothetical protein
LFNEVHLPVRAIAAFKPGLSPSSLESNSASMSGRTPKNRACFRFDVLPFDISIM